MSGIQKILKTVRDLFSLTENENGAVKAAKTSRGPIPFKDLAESLHDTLKKHSYTMITKTKVPTHFFIRLNKSDRSRFSEFESDLIQQLIEQIYPACRDSDPSIRPEDIIIEMKIDDNLQPGHFNISAHMQPLQAKSGSSDIEDSGLTRLEVRKSRSKPPPQDEENTTVLKQQSKKEEKAPLYTLVIEDSHGLREIPVQQKKLTLGRSKSDDVVLESPDRFISRAHAAIEAEDGHFFLTPHGPNGTFLGDEELTPDTRIELNPGDAFRIENYTMHIQ